MSRPTRQRPSRSRRTRVITLPQLMSTAVEADPDGIAIVLADATSTLAELTYAELDERSTRLARLLIARGIGPEDLVAVAFPRSLEAVIALWAVAKAGAGFVPVDPDDPAQRIAHIVVDSGVVLGLTVAATRPALPGTTPWLAVDTAGIAVELEEFAADPVTYADRLRPLRAEHPAYVVYTVDAIGAPHGVVVTQAGLSVLSDAQRARYQADGDSRTLAFAAPSDDASVLELLLAVGGAATMVVAAPTVRGGDELAPLLLREDVTHAYLPSEVLESLDPAGLDELRVVICAGRSYPPELVDDWTRPIGAGPFGAAVRRFLHGYGSAETTVLTNVGAPDSPAEASGIGAPNPGVTEYVLDERLSPVPDGETGELYVAGAQLARGYLRRPAQTAAHFVANPFLGKPDGVGLSAADSRLFRTGDLVRRSADGAVEYVGPAAPVVTAGIMPGVRDRLERSSVEGSADVGAGDAAQPGAGVSDTGSVEVRSAVPTIGRASEDSAAEWGPDLRIGGPARGEQVVAETDSAGVPSTEIDHSLAVWDSSGATASGSGPADVSGGERADSNATGALGSGFGPLSAEEPVTRWADVDPDAEDTAAEAISADTSDVRPREDRSFDANDLVGGRESAGTADAGSEQSVVDAAAEPESGPEAETSAVAIPLTAMPRPSTTVEFEDTELPGVPLSAAQQRMWAINRSDPETAAHNVCFAVRISARIRVEALQVAVVDVIERHEMLRTAYPVSDERGYQVVLPLDRVLADLAPEPLEESEIEDWLGEYARIAFDVTTEIPVRIGIAQIGEDDHVVVVVAHRIAADEASVTPFLRDLAVALLGRRNRAKPSWAPLPVQYADYALWQRSVLGDAAQPDSVAAQEIDYWRTALAGITDGPDLPADRPRPAVPSGRGAVYAFTVDREVHAGLLDLACAAGGTLFTALHTGFAALIARLSGAGDIVVCTAASGRRARELGSAIGLFENPLILRARLDPTMSFADLLATVTNDDLVASEHAELPFGLLAEALGESARVYPSWLRVALTVREQEVSQVNLPGLSATAVEFDSGVAEFDLRLNVFPRTRDGEADGLSATFTYATDLFDEITVAGFAERLVLLLEAVTADPRRPVGDVELLQPDERMRILGDWNNTRYSVEPGLLLDGYRRAVREHPDAIAVSSAELELTYTEFDVRVNQLARLLISRGVGPETMVVLAISPSLDLLIGMYAIVTAGGAYVPVDPDHPAERIGYILDTVRPVCVVSTVADSVPVPPDTQVLRLDTMDLSGFDPSPVRPEELSRPLRPGHPAYVIFTSGSTGRPKGVMVSHAAIDHQLAWMLAAYPLASDDVYLQKTPPTYDASLWGYFLPLLAGARLRLAAAGRTDPLYLAESIIAHGVTVTDFVPSQLAAFVDRTAPGICPTLREIFVIGEVLPAWTVTAFQRISDARVHNLYGPTEAAVSVTYWPAGSADGANVPIGLPQWNTRVYVLDDRLRPVPVGVPGELYLAGAALARGYANRPDLTADRFVADPFSGQDAGGRMYRTGDLVVWREGSGELPARLDFLGRTDFQINIRGRRIEPGEIEVALLAQSSVGDAVVVARDGRLVAYVAPRAEKRIVTERVAASLAEVLPEEFIPDVVVPMDALPRTTAGKLDRRALPDPSLGVETSSSLKVVRVDTVEPPRTGDPVSSSPVQNETPVRDEPDSAAESGWLSKQWKLGPLSDPDASAGPDSTESERRTPLPRRSRDAARRRAEVGESDTASSEAAAVSDSNQTAPQEDSDSAPDGSGSSELGSGDVPGSRSQAGWSPRVVPSDEAGAARDDQAESDSSSRAESGRLPRRAAGWSPRVVSSSESGAADDGQPESDSARSGSGRASRREAGWLPRVVSSPESDAADDDLAESDPGDQEWASEESTADAEPDSPKLQSGLSSLRAGFDRGLRSGAGGSPTESSSESGAEQPAQSPGLPSLPLRRSDRETDSNSAPEWLSDNDSQAEPRTMLLPRPSVPQGPESDEAADVAVAADVEPVPLSPAQEWLWALNQAEHDAGGPVPAAYHLPFALRLTGSLDVESLGVALDDVIARHEVLRTVYPAAAEADSVAVQQVLSAAPRPALAAQRIGAAEVEAAVRELAAAPFDVTTELPLRVQLFEISDLAPGSRREYVLAVVVHRIAADNSALGPIVGDLMVAYAARTANHSPRWAPLSAQYADYVRWQRTVLGAESDPESVAAQQIAYWRGELAGLPEVLDLPGGGPRPAVASMAGAWTGVHIDAATHTALLELAHTHATTLSTVLQTAVAAFLARLSNGDDIAIGTPVPGRAAGEFEDLIGTFVNTVVLRTRLDPAESFSDLLIRQRDSREQAFAHADLPFASLVEALGLGRSTAHNPLFQVGVSVQTPARITMDLPGLTVEDIDTELEVAPVDLSLTVTETYDSDGNPSGIDGRIAYATDIFDRTAAEDLTAGLADLLTTLVSDPAQPLGAIGIGAPELSTRSDDATADSTETAAALTISAPQPVNADHPAVLGATSDASAADDFDTAAQDSGPAHRDVESADSIASLPPLTRRRGSRAAAEVSDEWREAGESQSTGDVVGDNDAEVSGRAHRDVESADPIAALPPLARRRGSGAAAEGPENSRAAGEWQSPGGGVGEDGSEVSGRAGRDAESVDALSALPRLARRRGSSFAPEKAEERRGTGEPQSPGDVGDENDAEVSGRVPERPRGFVADEVETGGSDNDRSDTKVARGSVFGLHSLRRAPASAEETELANQAGSDPLDSVDRPVDEFQGDDSANGRWGSALGSQGSEVDASDAVASASGRDSAGWDSGYGNDAYEDSADHRSLDAGWRSDSEASEDAGSGDGPTLVSLLEEAAEAGPEGVGIIASAAESGSGATEFTLGQLDAWANRLARYLISLGVGRGSVVALAVRRSVDLGVAVYAVAKAGGAALPIDPEGAVERNREILAGAGPVCVLADAEYPFVASNRSGGDGSFDAPTELLTPIGRTPAHRPATGGQPMVVRIDRLNLEGIPTHRLADAERIEPLRAAHPAWIIQSAGAERVVVSHAGAVGQLTGSTSEFGLDADGRALLATAATSDLAVWEFWSVALGTPVQLGEQAARPRTIPELMTSAVATNPNGPAVVFRGRSFTYLQLDRASSKLARRLVQLGAGPEKPVAVAIPRSLEALVTLWSVAKTGAAVVPVEPSLPGDRITDLVSDSGAILGVTVRAAIAGLPQIDGEWLVLDHPNFAAEVDSQAGEPISDAERITALLPDDGAYVLYGSADIDHSQGIVVAHEDLADLAEQASHYRLHRDSRVLALAAPSSDEAVLELVLALGAAAALVVAPATIGGGPELARLIRSERVTHAFLPEAALRTVDPASLDGVEVVVTDRAVAEEYSAADGSWHAEQAGYSEQDDYSAQGGYSEEAQYAAQEYSEQTAYAEQAEYHGLPEQLEQPGYTEHAEYADQSEQLEHAGYSEQAGYSQEAEYSEQTAYSWEAEHSEQAGYSQEGGYSQEADYSEQAEYSEYREYPEQPEQSEYAEHPAPADRPMTPAERIIAEARASAPPPEEFDSATALSAPAHTSPRRALPNRSTSAPALPRRGARAAEPAEPDAVAESMPSTSETEPDDHGSLPLPPRAVRLLEIDPSGRESRAIALDIPAGVPTENIRAAVRTLLERHPLLSARLAVPGRSGDDPLRAWSPVFAGSAREARLVLAQTPPDISPRRFVHSEGVAEMAVRTLAVELDPGQGRNIGFGLIDPPESAEPQDDSRTLVVAANGLVVDDASWRIIIEELSQAWSGGHTVLGDSAPAAPDAVAQALARPAADDSVRHEVSWWRRALADLPAESALDGVDLTARGRVSLVITAEGAAAVASVAASYHTDVEDVLLTALALAMVPDTRAAEILGPVVQLTVDGRALGGGESAGAVGGFTATYPLVPNVEGIDPDDALRGGASAGAAISRVKEQRRTVPAGGAQYGLLRYLDPATSPEMSALAHGRTAFRYRDLRPARPYPDTPAADLFLDITVDATAEGFRARFDYASAVLEADEVKELAGHWVRSLGGLAEHGTRPEAGGFTPSDFPMVPLTQDDIDRLRHDNPDLAEIWPVAPGQMGLLATAHSTGAAQFAVDLRGPLDDRRLRLSAQAVLDRHDGLRVAFGDRSYGSVQVISDPVDISWRTVDFTDLAAADARVEVERYQAADRLAPFDPQYAPLLRIALLKSASGTHRILLTAHPLLLDDRSLRLVMRDLLTVYARGPRSRQLPAVHPYRAYPMWLAEQNGAAARAVWREALSGYHTPALFAHGDGDRETSSATAEVSVELLPADAVELSGLATRLGVTVQMVVQAAWGLLLGRFADRDDVVFGVVAPGRSPQVPHIDTLVGRFGGIVPVRVRPEPDESLEELLLRIRSEWSARPGHYCPSQADMARSLGVDRLLDSVVMFRDDAADLAELSGIIDGIRIAGVDSAPAFADRVAVAVVLNGPIRLSLRYLTEEISESVANVLSYGLASVIRQIAAAPHTLIADLDLHIEPAPSDAGVGR
ncbi:amino acid adenylation domain-containing protein [Nocardia jiangxiensis]|uniref:Amino acid adenylation domain-containing protein n=1 Tax=Nocardia jiangxiensis TaxID=282685 RepID=A0ABW6RS29_9NOCA